MVLTMFATLTECTLKLLPNSINMKESIIQETENGLFLMAINTLPKFFQSGFDLLL